jgi:hypothetical protein
MGLLRAGTAVFLAALALAPAAQAAQRYAAPEAAGPEPCAQPAPCSLKQAITKAKTGDEVIVGTGTYAVKEPLSPEAGATNVYIHGDFNAPMPQIVGSSTPYTVVATTLDNRLAYLDLSNKGTGAYGVLCATGGSLARIRATAIGDFATGILAAGNCAVRDSVAVASGMNATALFASGSITTTSTATARNVTALAAGTGSKAAFAACFACFGASTKLDLKNAIANGVGADLETASSGAIVVSNSNFDKTVPNPPGSITDAGGNQAVSPQFIDAANGDYREGAESPTIDAGAVDQLGALDLGGNPRIVGAAPDIGAYEFVPPAPPPPPVGEIQSLAIAPKAFRPVNAGGAVLSARKKTKAPIGTKVTYTLSAAGSVKFAVERRLPGRKVGKRCVKQTRANRTKKKCSRFKRVKGGFTHSGQAGQNRFKFSGRIAGRGLKPGRYRLVGKTGSVSKRASFKIVK